MPHPGWRKAFRSNHTRRNVRRCLVFQWPSLNERSMSGIHHPYPLRSRNSPLLTPAISDLISKHEVVQLMDEEMTGEEVADLAEAEAICKRFLEWDLEDRQGLDIKAKLRWVLGIRDGQAAKD